VRVVLDARARIPMQSRLVQTARDIPVVSPDRTASQSRARLWVIAGAGTGQLQNYQALREAGGIDIVELPARDNRIELMPALRHLATAGMTRLMVEAGPRLTTALLRENLIDEVVLLRSPQLLGDDAIDALEGLPLEALTHAGPLRLIAAEAFGTDRKELYRRP
jgi:diaminohydroxyphosphoribosylaminopyrimidine deaminase/5-amino-6-(5-phosphoribosylamino)uracil reductase